MSEDLALRWRIAEDLLGTALNSEGFAKCPGADLHTSARGTRDFRVIVSGAPTGFCFHSHCVEAVEAFNLELRRRVARVERGEGPEYRPLGDGVPAKPEAPRLPKRPAFNPEQLASFAASCPRPVSLEWLRQRSPLPITQPAEQNRGTARAFLGALFTEGERVLVFTRQWSQGDFIFDPARGTFRLGDSPATQATPSPLPEGGPEGVWFLNQPVSGKWLPNPYAPKGDGPQPPGRRHGGCVLAWRHMVLESDEAEAGLWLRALVQLPLPIVAVYTSGGRSVHALVRVDARCKAEWDDLRDDLLPVLCPLGADPGALTAVRLTRLPGMLRHGNRGKDGKHVRWPSPRLQELVWLSPAAPALPILNLVH